MPINNILTDIEELIRMNMLKTELGARIENTTNDILRKKGINSNFNRILSQLFDPKNDSDNNEEKKDEEIE